MRERRDIYQLIAAEHHLGRAVALCTLVRVEGSFYRRPGARMAFTAAGASAGVLSGGCLDNELQRRALASLASGACTLASFTLGDDSDVFLGYGSGCPGRVEVFIEPLPPPPSTRTGRELPLVLALPESGGAAVATILAMDVLKSDASQPPSTLSVGTRLVWPLLPANASAQAADDDDKYAAALRHAIAAVSKADDFGTHGIPVGPYLVRLFIEPVAVVPNLHLFGAGGGGRELYAVASRLGWATYIYDHRRERLSAAEFPAAFGLTHTDFGHDWRPQLGGPGSACVLITHHFLKDLDILSKLLRLNPRPAYIGVIGARGRAKLLFDYLERQDGISTANLAGIYSPAGLAINAPGSDPAAIALAIAAEISQVLSAAPGGHLRAQSHTLTPMP